MNVDSPQDELRRLGVSFNGGKVVRKHIGAKNELRAAAWLLGRGYEVFRNVSSHGIIDLVAVSEDGDVLLIDVKTPCLDKNGKHLPILATPEQRMKGVRILYVFDNYCEFEDRMATIKAERECLNCSGLYLPKKGYQKFCCRECKNEMRRK